MRQNQPRWEALLYPEAKGPEVFVAATREDGAAES